MIQVKRQKVTPTYVVLCSPHWSSIDNLIQTLTDPWLGMNHPKIRCAIVIPESSLVVARSPKHEFFDVINSLGGAIYIVFFESFGWRSSENYRWIRFLLVIDKLLRVSRVKYLIRNKGWPSELLEVDQADTKLLACPSVFTAHDRRASTIEAAHRLSNLPAELTFHGNLLDFQLHAVLPDMIPGATYHARTKNEEEVLLLKGWSPSRVKILSLGAPKAEAGPSPTLLYLSRGSNNGNDTAASSLIERHAIKWLSETANRVGLELVVRLHPAESRFSFLLKWARCGLLLRRFRIDTKLSLPHADLVISLHSSAILAAQVPLPRSIELLPFGMLNERVGGPCLGYATRQGAANTVYTLEALIAHAERVCSGLPGTC